MKIEDSNLSTRAINAMLRNGITTLEDAQALTKEELEELRSVGKITANEIITGVRRHVPRPQKPLLEIVCEQYCRFSFTLDWDELELKCSQCPIRRRLARKQYERELEHKKAED